MLLTTLYVRLFISLFFTCPPDSKLGDLILCLDNKHSSLRDGSTYLPNHFFALIFNDL